MNKFFSVLAMAGASFAFLPQAWAQQAPPAKPKASNKAASKPAPAKKPVASAAKAAAPQAAAALDEDDIVPDLQGSISVVYQCALGDKVTLYGNYADDQHIAVRWGKSLHRLKRMQTTTGAHRFENRKYGLVWIGIPAKGMLLDSKKGQQLANDCKNPDQLIAQPAPAEAGARKLLAEHN